MTEEALNRQVIVFHLNNEAYAVSVQYVKFVERLQPITRLPNTSSFIKGVMNLRGVVTPVIDLRTRLGMQASELTEENRMIIVARKDIEVGLIVDSTSDVLDIPEKAIEPLPETSDMSGADYIEGVVQVENRLIMLLQLDHILFSSLTTNIT